MLAQASGQAIGAIEAIGLQCARSEPAGPAGGVREPQAGDYLPDPESPAERKFALYNTESITI